VWSADCDQKLLTDHPKNNAKEHLSLELNHIKSIHFEGHLREQFIEGSGWSTNLFLNSFESTVNMRVRFNMEYYPKETFNRSPSSSSSSWFIKMILAGGKFPMDKTWQDRYTVTPLYHMKSYVLAWKKSPYRCTKSLVNIPTFPSLICHDESNGSLKNMALPSKHHETSIWILTFPSLGLQTPSDTVFWVGFWGLNTFSEGIWSARVYHQSSSFGWWF
jgi:hypothetical protein